MVYQYNNKQLRTQIKRSCIDSKIEMLVFKWTTCIHELNSTKISSWPKWKRLERVNVRNKISISYKPRIVRKLGW